MKQIFFPLLLGLVVILASCSGGSSSSKKQAKTSDSSAKNSQAEMTNSNESNAKPHPGEALYKTNCLTCHQADGSGVPNMYPPLSPNEWIRDKDKLIDIMLHGLKGEIQVGDETYNNAMPPHNGMTNQELADVLSYVRSSFGNNLEPITQADVAAARTK